MKIKYVKAREVLDSRGQPTVEAEINGFKAISPEGASKGKYEAVEIRDGGSRYRGLGVQRAVDNINKIISKRLTGMELDQQRVDEILCSLAGSNKWKLGSNATTAVSIAACKAAAEGDAAKFVSVMSGSKQSIPVPFFNVINGGAHAENELDMQEFMILPVKFHSFSAALQAGCEIYYQLKELIIKKHGKNAANVGDEGGFAPPLSNTRDALSLICDAVEEAGYSASVKLALDAAASRFFRGSYYLDGKKLTAMQLADYYIDLAKLYPIISIEDPFNEEDFDSFALLKRKAKRFAVVGDDLTATNIQRLRKAIDKDACDSLLVKINQVGTVTEAIEAAKLARKAGWSLIVSHRSGDSEDSFVADFAVGLGAFGAKFGAPDRAERTAKYNQLLRLEDETGAIYSGRTFKPP